MIFKTKVASKFEASITLLTALMIKELLAVKKQKYPKPTTYKLLAYENFVSTL